MSTSDPVPNQTARSEGRPIPLTEEHRKALLDVAHSATDEDHDYSDMLELRDGVLVWEGVETFRICAIDTGGGQFLHMGRVSPHDGSEMTTQVWQVVIDDKQETARMIWHHLGEAHM